MYESSPILTMTCPNGSTHIEREQKFSIEQQKRLMEFMTSPAVREIAEQIGRDLAAEYMKAVAPGGCAHNRGL